MRKSGVLLPVFSLDGHYGIGSLGRRAYEFAEILRLCGQHMWQILPTGPTGFGNSPYQSTSSYAGNILLIDVELLVEQGLLTYEEIAPLYCENNGKVDYEALAPIKQRVIQNACENFIHRASPDLQYAFSQFCLSYDELWLQDFAMFEVLSQIHDGKPWYEWPDKYRHRDAQTLVKFSSDNAAQINCVKIAQFIFDMQWQALHAYCKQNYIELIGDIPLFIAHNSVDAWCYRSLFYFNHQGHCTVVAGVPPDYFSETGQRWGNPLYRWSNHELTHFKWWRERLDYLLSRVDLLRIDHFRGLESYWEIDASEENAIKGRWLKAPGEKLLMAYLQHNPYARFIAEDLGIITEEVEQLRDQFSLPGMKVLQFAFDGDDRNVHLPKNYLQNAVAYTSTHDNDTLVGWLDSRANYHHIAEAFSLPHEAINHWSLIYAVMSSVADRAIFPLQDILGLETEARMNTPSVLSLDNWSWRLRLEQFSIETQKKLYDLTVQTRRCVAY